MLPTPTPDEVSKFKQSYQQEFGIELTDTEAWEAATKTQRLFCLATDGQPERRES